jgi:hypothetical protein
MSFSPEPLVIFSRIKHLWSPVRARFAHFKRGLHERVQGTNNFVYEPLDLEQSQIRLLKLLPGNGRQRIECASFTASLEEKGFTYEALSYTWGSKHTTDTILLDGKPFLVTSNLNDALRRLRHPDESRTLWVDAICINQQDNTERSQQVGLMRRIYNQASKVVIWLGSRKCDKRVCKFLDGATGREDSAAWIQGMLSVPLRFNVNITMQAQSAAEHIFGHGKS